MSHHPNAIVPHFKDEIMALRREKNANGKPLSFQDIADRVGFAVGAVWLWVKRWEQENDEA